MSLIRFWNLPWAFFWAGLGNCRWTDLAGPRARPRTRPPAHAHAPAPAPAHWLGWAQRPSGPQRAQSGPLRRLQGWAGVSAGGWAPSAPEGPRGPVLGAGPRAQSGPSAHGQPRARPVTPRARPARPQRPARWPRRCERPRPSGWGPQGPARGPWPTPALRVRLAG